MEAASSWDPGLLLCFICFMYQAATKDFVWTEGLQLECVNITDWAPLYRLGN